MTAAIRTILTVAAWAVAAALLLVLDVWIFLATAGTVLL